MEKIKNTTLPDELYAEFLATISDLTESMAIAVVRLALRDKLDIAMADAEKAERAAEALYFTTIYSTEMTERDQVSGVAQTATAGQQNSSLLDAHTSTIETLDEVSAACQRLGTALVPSAEPEGGIHSAESVIAMRILELQDRLGGFIKH